MPCSGIRISKNTFTDNFGCYKYGGSLISMQCVPNLSTVKLPAQTNNMDEVGAFVVSSNVKNDFFTFNYDSYLYSGVENLLEIDYDGTPIEIDQYRITLDQNTYLNNYAGHNEGLLDFKGL